MVGIYKITNPEGQSYIGLSKNIEQRWISHKNLQFKGNIKLKNSLKLYSIESHIWDVIEIVDIEHLSLHEGNAFLRKRERYWITFYNSFKDGLNENGGGSGCGSHTKESKQKISKALKGKSKPSNFGENRKKWQHNEEWKKKISASKKGKSSPLKGKNRSYKGRISPNKGKGKPIIQYDLNMNQIQEFSSLSKASQILNIPQPSISECLRKKYKTAGGYIFNYKI